MEEETFIDQISNILESKIAGELNKKAQLILQTLKENFKYQSGNNNSTGLFAAIFSIFMKNVESV